MIGHVTQNLQNCQAALSLPLGCEDKADIWKGKNEIDTHTNQAFKASMPK